MNDGSENIIKSIILYDAALGIIIGVLTLVFFGTYSLFFILGLFVAIVNFLLNAILLKNILLKQKINLAFLITLLGFLRVFIIAYIGSIIFKISANSCIAYMLGFCSHFISLLAYSVINNLFLGRK